MYGIAVVLLDGHGAGDDGDDLAAGEELPPRLSRFALPDSGLNAAVVTGELDICTCDDVSAEWLCTGLAEQCLLEDPTCAVQLCGTEGNGHNRSEEHTSELQSLMRISYAVFCLK